MVENLVDKPLKLYQSNQWLNWFKDNLKVTMVGCSIKIKMFKNLKEFQWIRANLNNFITKNLSDLWLIEL